MLEKSLINDEINYIKGKIGKMIQKELLRRATEEVLKKMYSERNFSELFRPYSGGAFYLNRFLLIFTKNSILDFRQGFEYASEQYMPNLPLLVQS